MKSNEIAATRHPRLSAAVMTAILLASLPAAGHTDDSVDNALKGRDLNTIMDLLKQDVQSDGGESVPPAATSPQRSTPGGTSRETPKIRRLRPVSAPEASPASKTTTPVRTSEGKSESFTREELDRLQSSLADELKTARETADREAAATRAAMDTRMPVAVEPAPMMDAETTSALQPEIEKSRGLLGRLFGGGKEKTEVSEQFAEAGVETSAPVRRTEITERPAVQVRSNAMKANRDRLEELISRSRADVVRRSMEEKARVEEASAPVYSEDDWKKAGPDAWRYNGEWQDGAMHGQGRLVYADGWEYVGMWKEGTMHGQGTLVHPDGTIYEGQWANGMMDGLGKLTYPDGWQFIGQWRAGKIQGQGTLVHPGN